MNVSPLGTPASLRASREIKSPIQAISKHRVSSLDQKQFHFNGCCVPNSRTGCVSRRPGVRAVVSVWMTQVAGRSGGCDSDYTS